jgi:hypothetical protein
MVVVIEQGHACILVGPTNDPDSATMLWVGPKFRRARSALRHAKSVYFKLYLDRYGFHHPESPHAIKGTVLPASVAVMQSSDHEGPRVYSQTYDPDQRGSRHGQANEAADDERSGGFHVPGAGPRTH